TTPRPGKLDHGSCQGMVVDGYGAHVEPSGEVPRAIYVPGPERTGKAVLPRVDPSNRIGCAVYHDHGDHRPEGLFRNDGHGLVAAGEQSRFDEVAVRSSSGLEHRSLLNRIINLAHDEVALRRKCQRGEGALADVPKRETAQRVA